MFLPSGEGFLQAEQLSPHQLTKTAQLDGREMVLISLAGEIKHPHLQRFSVYNKLQEEMGFNW